MKFSQPGKHLSDGLVKKMAVNSFSSAGWGMAQTNDGRSITFCWHLYEPLDTVAVGEIGLVL